MRQERTYHDRRRFVGGGAMALIGGGFGLFNRVGEALTSVASHLPTEDELASLRTATAWLNSRPLTEGDLRGKSVLIDICTYTCINWLRTLPYVRAWNAEYARHGLVVIGVHSPEFAFEHDLDNVGRAVKRLGVEHPIAIDNTFSIWRAFRNRFWPARYLVDGRGRLRHRQFGEGEYERSARAIREVLSDAGARGVERAPISVAGQGIEAAPDWDNLMSHETYLGYERTDNFAPVGGFTANKRRHFTPPERLKLNQWALAGDWTAKREATILNQANGRILYRFHARDLHLVMGPSARGATIRFRVLLDGKPPGVAHGTDVDERGYGVLDGHRLYQLVRQPRPIVDRDFAIEFLSAGVEAFAFTFG